MKVYKLRFTESDFVSKQTDVWRTDVIDLYDNAQYKNYSVLQSTYGTDLLGTGVYTGLNTADNINTEIGYVNNGRFIDTSGRIDIFDWKVSVSQVASAAVLTKLNLYSAEEGDATPYFEHATPDLIGDWAIISDLQPGDPISSLRSPRYVFFELEFQSDADIQPTSDVELIVAIEIDPPVVNGFFDGTRRALDRFPEWMEMREWDPATPEDGATPTKVGSTFINAVAGEWLSDLRGKINYHEFQKYIENVDLDQKAWVYRTSNVPTDVFSVTFYNGVSDEQLAITSGPGEFYGAANDEHAYFYNQTTAEIYSLQTYPDGQFKINGEVFVQELYQVWNALDDLGIVVDLYRLPNESNDSFRKRILDVYISSPGVSAERFKKSVRRELNLWKYYGATPDSNYVGATPDILTIEDLENSSDYFNADGNPKPAFYELVDRLARTYPMTWGLFNYSEAYWDMDGLYHKGFKTLPKLNDATPASGSLAQSGVGDLNDLYVLRPDFYKPEQTFDVTLAIRGRRPTPTNNVYTEATFNAAVTGIANATAVEVDNTPSKFTFRISTNNITYYYGTFEVSAGYYGGDPDVIDLSTYSPGGTWPPPPVTDEAKGHFDWYTDQGLISGEIQFYDYATGLPADEDFQPSLASLQTIRVYPGEYDFNTTSYINQPDDDLYRLTFIDPATPHSIGEGSGSTFLEINTGTVDYTTENYTLEYESLAFTATPDSYYGFTSIPQLITVTVNKNNVLQNAIVNISHFDWPDYNGPSLEANKLQIQITDTDENGNFGFYTNTGLFINVSNLEINTEDSWVDGVLVIDVNNSGNYQLEFDLDSATSYPETINVWNNFSQTIVLSGQKVSEHGPYRYGVAPVVGNVDTTLSRIEVTRAKFSIGVNDVPTWIGVQSVSNPNVVTWTSANLIIPLDSERTEYPPNALVENDDRIGFLDIHARIKADINPQWNPFIHSGWFTEDDENYYFFAQPETATVSSGSEFKLVFGSSTPTQNYQGAPIVVDKSGTPFRQIPHFGATPPNDFIITEIKNGTGTNTLYAGYENIKDITVRNLSLDQSVIASSSTSNNEIICGTVTNKDHEYEIKYKPILSFYADNISTPGQTVVNFSEAAAGTPYFVTWENSEFNPATPVPLPLHPLHSAITESFVYIDHDEQPLASVDVSISPSEMLATPGDYSMVTVLTYDRYGNPKANVKLSIATGAGTSTGSSTVYTDEFGYASFYIESSASATPGNVVISYESPIESSTPVTGQVIQPYAIEKMPFNGRSIKAVMDSPEIIADGNSAVELFGYVYNNNDQPVPYAVVRWRKARDIYSLFNEVSWSGSTATPGQSGIAGQVVADANGRFVVGPFVSQDEPGYWMVSVESNSASPSTNYDLTGDITYWYEYLGVTNIIDPVSLQPIISWQQSTPAYMYPDFSSTPGFPVTFDERDYHSTPATPTIDWLPPTWFPISRYDQYQLQLLGDDFYEVDVATPPYNDNVES